MEHAVIRFCRGFVIGAILAIFVYTAGTFAQLTVRILSGMF